MIATIPYLCADMMSRCLIYMCVWAGGMLSVLYSQKIGLVLSGGGANAAAHIGVIKALEENHIPIDYIAGTSMGALVGALYAAGYSPAEMEAIFTSEEFLHWASGEIEEKYQFYFKKNESDASIVTIKVSPDSTFQTNLPTSIISSVPIDFALMKLLAAPIAVADYNFDSLMIPFRCVAADIISKRAVVFSKGYLPTAVRASMTYPFYLRPLKIGDKLLYDGGIYNNFPADVLYNDFMPDFIIGSNVSYNFPEPDEDNLISQLRSMLVSNTEYTIQCKMGYIITPDTKDYGTFDFKNIKEIIQKGYKATIQSIDSIRQCLPPVDTYIAMEEKRKAFNQKKKALSFGRIIIEGLDSLKSNYVLKGLIRKKMPVPLPLLEKDYMKLMNDDKIKDIYPEAVYNKHQGNYDLYLKIKKEKDLFVSFGGNVSSRPINQGYVGLQYNILRSLSYTLKANTYFGRFYSSAMAGIKIDFPYRFPFYFSSQFVLNKWDYYKSYSTFFEDVKPSYVVLNERFIESSAGFPLGRKFKIITAGNYFDNQYEYYQVNNFQLTDTTDKTFFYGYSAYILLDKNNLDRKQYPSRGGALNLKIRYVEGQEETILGKRQPMTSNVFFTAHDWILLKASYEQYFIRKLPLRLGILLEGVYSTQKFFENYRASLLLAPAFQPIPESRTLFQDRFRTYSYVAAGFKTIFVFTDKIHLRIENYLFQPYRIIWADPNLKPYYVGSFTYSYYIGSMQLVYHSPIGPIALNLNYYDQTEDHWSFLFHFGYILFNKKSLD